MTSNDDLLDQAQELKKLGNEQLKCKNYEGAIDYYTQAIAKIPTAVFYANRAQAHIKKENFGLALNDANEAIKLNKNYLKGYYRRAVAYSGMLEYKKSLKDIETVIKHAPNDKNALKMQKNLKAMINQIRFEKAIQVDDEVSVFDELDFKNMLDDKDDHGLPDLHIETTQRTHKMEGMPKQVVSVKMTKEYLTKMIEIFKDGKTLPKKHAYAIVAAAMEVIAKEHSLVEIGLPRKTATKSKEYRCPTAKKITVCGDTHGQFYDVMNIFKTFGHVSPEHTYLFNGDFVDRGSWSTEVAFFFYSLKLLYPNNFYLDRGNHETNDMNQVYGFQSEIKAKYTDRLYRCFSTSFTALPYSTLIGQQYLVMHGGLFSRDDVTLDEIRSIDRFKYKQPPKEGIEMELLWTDPQPENGRSPSKRGIGLQFGPDVTKKFCDNNHLKMIFRSHEVRAGGYEIEHNGRLATVFSAPKYCDADTNLGASVTLTLDDEDNYIEDFKTFKAVPHPNIPPMAYCQHNFGF